MSEWTLYHNPRCSKSREALALLNEQGIDPEIRLYLQEPPDETELRALLKALGYRPRQLLRSGEDLYAELGLADAALDDETLLRALLDHPRLMERPIARRGAQARVGRPPQTVLELL